MMTTWRHNPLVYEQLFVCVCCRTALSDSDTRLHLGLLTGEKKNKPLSVLILYSKKYWHDLDFLEWTNQSRLIDCQVRANNTSSIIITVNSRKKRSSFDGGTARMSISRSYLEWLIQARKWRKKKLLPAVEGSKAFWDSAYFGECVCVSIISLFFFFL